MLNRYKNLPADLRWKLTLALAAPFLAALAATLYVLFRDFMYGNFGTPNGIDPETLSSTPRLIAFWSPGVAGSAVIYLLLLWLPELRERRAQAAADDSQQPD